MCQDHGAYSSLLGSPIVLFRKKSFSYFVYKDYCHLLLFLQQHGRYDATKVFNRLCLKINVNHWDTKMAYLKFCRLEIVVSLRKRFVPEYDSNRCLMLHYALGIILKAYSDCHHNIM